MLTEDPDQNEDLVRVPDLNISVPGSHWYQFLLLRIRRKIVFYLFFFS